jgi:hypothetical protein
LILIEKDIWYSATKDDSTGERKVKRPTKQILGLEDISIKAPDTARNSRKFEPDVQISSQYIRTG